ncbi:MAG TPA: hypothetical protein VL371_20705 [Gemmataceae bacterium]|jgi:hypothetical protein|nr:hypothetical protein [Gemmataceae bacterium]
MSAQLAARGSLLALVAVVIPAVWVWADPPAANDAIRVTIVAITASDKHTNIDPRLKNLAREVRKQHDQALTGYKLGETVSKPVAVGQKENFKLVDDASADITVLQKDDTNQRIRLAVKLPFVGEITYSTCYEKFFPIITRYTTRTNQERLIVAIMVRQSGKDGKDAKEPKTR